MNYEYGRHTPRLLYVRDQHIPALTSARGAEIMAHAGRTGRDENTAAHYRALTAARQWGIEQDVIAGSEMLRRALWGVVWDSTWADAWSLQWVLARAAVGLGTQHLIGLAEYGIEDYITLVSPWTVGFQDLPLPYTEGLAA